MQVELTDEQKDTILEKCFRAVREEEAIQRKAIPRKDLVESVIGNRSIRVMFPVMAIILGLINLIFWQWIFDLFDIELALTAFGIPVVIATNLPEVLAVVASSTTAWHLTYQWGVEGRVYWLNQACNAHERASILHSVVQELEDVFPDAVPDLDDYVSTAV